MCPTGSPLPFLRWTGRDLSGRIFSSSGFLGTDSGIVGDQRLDEPLLQVRAGLLAQEGKSLVNRHRIAVVPFCSYSFEIVSHRDNPGPQGDILATYPAG